ncbi:YbgA family protein [Methanolobus halotolerans]|uniref:DUF1722 domain-containing protein n=1 Tax=Methanolobus halotolerans TaxID=2052935 RepID=A0A4E0Q6S4_9EURY|nr:DUF523 and DUF1722 domain-containing protein [Methanolobus halotolerans]TGC10587.1 DUF1722 domain-containing protein [Methanolobus halotolerans]
MPRFTRPIIVVSKCLGFAPCRYDGQMVSCSFVGYMEKFVDFIDVCPECEVGLGIPRRPIRIVLDGKKRLIQPATGIDITLEMERFTESYLEDLDDFDGFILKSGSPSCGIGTTKAYTDAGSNEWSHKQENGFFADAIVREYPHLPRVDDEQLNDVVIRDHFLTKVFSLSSFREAASSVSIRSLIEYHARNKFLFMVCDKHLMVLMGNVVANREGLPAEEVFAAYLNMLLKILSKPAETGSTINAMMHTFGYLSRYLDARDKFIFLQELQGYREDSSVLSGLKEKLMSWALHFNVEYISEQTFLCPYPRELIYGNQNLNFR